MRLFCGQPIWAYSIQAVLETGIFNEVMVSTDGKEIAKVAKKYGARVPFFRSSKNSDDCGQFYCYDVEKYLACKGEIIKDMLPIEISELEVQDIDNEEEWKIAELKYQFVNRNN